MESSFSKIELLIIRKNMGRMTDTEISEMLGKPVGDVHEKINEMTGGGVKSKSRSMIIELKKIKKTRKVKKPEKQEDLTLRLRAKQREQDRIQRMKIEEQRRANKEKRDAESKFTTKKVDYSQKHLVRIDSKTYFYINPGENEQVARKKFMETYSKSFKKDEEHASPKEIITKVCRRCKEDKPIKRFYRDTRSTDTRESVCIDCREEQKLIGKRKKR